MTHILKCCMILLSVKNINNILLICLNRKPWWKILSTVYQEHGVRKGLYRGISINYLRVVPMTALSFTVFESMKQILGLDTGVTR